MLYINNLISTLNFCDFAALREILTSESELVYDYKMLNADTSINNKNASLNLINQEITYNAYILIQDIAENDYDNNTNKLKFYYGTYEFRNKMEMLTNDVVDSTKIYAGNVERIIKTGENAFIRELTYIPSPTGLAAVFIKDSRDEQQPEGRMFYVLKDHLGSITALVDEAGDLRQEYSFDAWGRRRHPDTWQCFSTEDLQKFKPLVSRGYTGHEHLDRFGLINMNGRLYDPVLGRMLSPDNFAQNPESSQGYNRYSYCNNNPLKYTDPSGEKHFGAIDYSNWEISSNISFNSSTCYPTGNSRSDWNDYLASNNIGCFKMVNAGFGWAWLNGNPESGEMFLCGNYLVTGGGGNTGVSDGGGGTATTSEKASEISPTSGVGDGTDGQGPLKPPPMTSVKKPVRDGFASLDVASFGFHGVSIRIIPGDYSSYFAGAINTSQDVIDNYEENGLDSWGGRLLMHEFGHYLQRNAFGFDFYYGVIASSSVWNINTLDKDSYSISWTEVSANILAYYYFNCPSFWISTLYPINPYLLNK